MLHAPHVLHLQGAENLFSYWLIGEQPSLSVSVHKAKHGFNSHLCGALKLPQERTLMLHEHWLKLLTGAS
jgi:hypothetical protein